MARMTLLSVEHVGKTHWVGPYEKRVLVDVSLAMRARRPVRRVGRAALGQVDAAAHRRRPRGARRRRRAVRRHDLATLPKAQRDRLRLGEIGLVQGDGPQSGSFSVLDYVAVPLFNRCTRRDARNRALATLDASTWPSAATPAGISSPTARRRS